MPDLADQIAPADLHIFKNIPLDVIVEKTLYSHRYLLDIRDGLRPITDKFKERAEHGLGVSREVLFAPALAREGGAESKEGSNGHDVGDEGVG